MSEIKQVTTWIDAAVQKPSVRNVANYAAFLFSEVGEMAETLKMYELARHLEDVSRDMRRGFYDLYVEESKKEALLDDACDSAWVSIGLMHMLSDAQGAFNEVVASNYSKFENGVCELDATGKVVKGPGYFKPDLAKYLRG